MELLIHTASTGLSTVVDVLPIAVILFGFQALVIRRRPPKLKRVLSGFVYVLVGLTFFLVGLEQALFPLGETVASQLTAPEFIHGSAEPADGPIQWRDYFWVYVFAATIGFSTTIAEPSLIAVAIGVAAGVSIGAYRIVSGTPLPYYIMAGYVVVILQNLRASKFNIPLAFDSGGVTTSTVTVPVVAALGRGLASTIPGRSPLIDEFGLIAFASVFPIMSVMAYAMLTEWLRARRKGSEEGATEKEKTP